MNWSDERYVRLYTRDTVTWKRWHWQTRAVLALLIRRVDRSGVLDTGKGDKAEAMALMLEVPVEVARGALEQMVACGTVTVSDTAIVLPTFIAAQEAKQSDKVRQIESRERRAAAAMRNHEDACHTVSQPVTDRHTVSQIVTPAVPSRAVPCLAVPEKNTETASVSALLELVPTPKPKAKKPPPTPEENFKRFAESMTDDEARVFEAYEKAFNVALGADWKLKKLVTSKLRNHPASELVAAIRGHAADPWRRANQPTMGAIFRDASYIANMAKAGAA